MKIHTIEREPGDKFTSSYEEESLAWWNSINDEHREAVLMMVKEILEEASKTTNSWIPYSARLPH